MIGKSGESETKRANLNISAELHNRFKSATAAQSLNMTNVIIEFIHNYVR